MPFISVIIPTNRVGGVDIVLNSLARSKFTDFEVVLVDSHYDRRRELLAEEARNRFLRLVHVGLNPQPNYCCFCAMANAGIVASSGEVLLFAVDYSRFPEDLLGRHAEFHRTHGEHDGLMCPHRYVGLDVDPSFPKYEQGDVDGYDDDTRSGEMDRFMWSIGGPLDRPSLPHKADGGAIVPPDADPKLRMPAGAIDACFFHAKNESVRRSRVLEIDGWDQDLDGAHLYQDSDFADRLTVKAGVKWTLDPTNVIEIANPRHVFPFARRLRPHESNYQIWQAKKAAGYPSPKMLLHELQVKNDNGLRSEVADRTGTEPGGADGAKTAASSPVSLSVAGAPNPSIGFDSHAATSDRKLNIAMIYGAFSSAIHGKFDIEGLYTRVGLTGSESSFFNLARTLAERGYNVAVFCDCDRVYELPSGLAVLPIQTVKEMGRIELDAVIAWNEPDYLQFAPKGVPRIVDQQLNDWNYCRNPQWQSLVDCFVFPSEDLRRHHCEDEKVAAVVSLSASGRSEVIPNSVDLDMFAGARPYRHPHRVVYCSSPDRGLHHLLGIWPEVRRHVPDAKLKIFYRIKPWFQATLLHPEDVGRRARYIEAAIAKLAEHGVEVVGPVPNAQMARELQSAAVLAYPCDPVRYTEGFGCSVLDAAAGGCVPIISDADALPSVHRGAAIVIAGKPDGVEQRDAWINMIISSLKNGTLPGWDQKMAEHAERHSRQNVADQWEAMLSRICN